MSTLTSLLTATFLFLIIVVSQPLQAESAVETYKDIVWASPKGFRLTLDIRAPTRGKQTKDNPVLVIFHGGGWLLNTKEIMSDLAEYVASHGHIVTVNVNYRLLADLKNTTTSNEIIEDAMGAVLWVKDNIKKYGGDPQRIAVTGDSAGGHLAAMVVLAGRNLSSDRFSRQSTGFKPTYLPAGQSAEKVAKADGLKVQAAILSYAGFSLYTAAENGFESSNNPFWKWANAAPRGLFGPGFSLKSHPEYYRAVSPIEYVVSRKVYALPPQLVLVGEKDQLTPPATARKYVELLRQSNQPVLYKTYPNKGHGFLDSGCNDYTNGCFKELSVPAVDDILDFLKAQFRSPK